MTDAGVPETTIGLTLQRGGEELMLLKVGDRFTVQLTAPDAPLPDSLSRLNRHLLPQTALWEFIIAPASLETAMTAARQSDSVTFASHVYQLQNSPETLAYLTEELTVQFAAGLRETEQKALTQPLGLECDRPLAGIPDTYIYHLTPAATENPIKVANRLMAHTAVLTAEPNIIFLRESFYRPQDTHYDQQWYLNHNGGHQLAPTSHLDCEKAWDLQRGTRSVVVAIMDDAIDINHPDFQGAGKIVAPYDFRDRDFAPLPTNTQESHGTACAGVAVAEENGQGVVGVAPGCALMPLRTTGYLDDRSIESLFNWAIDKGASVISCSWGAASVHFPLSLRQRAVIHRAATEGRGGKGCVVVFAAGNANRPVQGTIYERGWPNDLLSGPTDWLSGFGTHPDVITVSACTSLGTKSSYSNWGTHISVCAPSNNAPPGMWFPKTGFAQTAPTINYRLPGLGIFTTDQLGSLGYDRGDFTRDFGGTSSACPVVAGVAALVLSANPNLTAVEVKEVLQQTADKIVDRDRDPQLGLQLGTYDSKGHSQWFGYGKVNAYAAVKEAQRRLPQRNTPVPTRQKISRRSSTAAPIPDHNPQGLLSSLEVSQAGAIAALTITIDLVHEFLGDLEIKLRSPHGITVLLQGRTLGSLTHLKRTYTPAIAPVLQSFLQQPAQGTWQLWVIDRVLGDTGTLQGWGLDLDILAP
ncbi:S8 family serine peptidase [Spirulina major]|uniref:S8 family serine peptidase n=1 Tax=Spirulina major TaxID=270636 RepID=UPI000934A71E|nr:S8 family serine peptidase [Spirulina major]